MAGGSKTTQKKNSKPVSRVIRKRKRRKTQFSAVSNRRRNTVKGRRRRRSSYILYYILVALAVMLAITVLSLTVLFKTEEITVSGGERYSHAEIVRISGITVGENLFRLKTGKIEDTLETELPYVEEAQIKRRIPSTVLIKITEAVPTYVVETDSLQMIVSGQFKALELLNGDVPENLILIKGLSVSECTVGHEIVFENKEYAFFLHDLVKALANNDFQVRAIQFEPSGLLKLNYQERIIIDMGSPVDLDHKIKMAKNVLENQLAVTDSGILYITGDNTTSFRLDTGNLGLEYKINPDAPEENTP